MSHNSKKIMSGALIGGVVSSVAALLLTPKSGEFLRKNICGTCHDIMDAAEGICKSVKCHSDKVCETASCLIGKGKCLCKKCQEGIEKGRLLCKTCEDEEECSHDLFIGAAIGGVLGALAGVLIAPKPGSELRQDIADTYEDVSEKINDLGSQGKAFIKSTHKKSNKWLERIKSAINEFSEDAVEHEEEIVHQSREHLNDILEWASLGMRVWKTLSKK